MNASELMENTKQKMEKINSISRKHGKRRVYPDDFKNDLAILAKTYSSLELSKSLGIPDNSLYTILKRASHAIRPVSKKIKRKKQNRKVATAAINFMELPVSLMNRSNDQQKISIPVPNATQSKLVMKFVTYSGTTIEIFE